MEGKAARLAGAVDCLTSEATQKFHQNSCTEADLCKTVLDLSFYSTMPFWLQVLFVCIFICFHLICLQIPVGTFRPMTLSRPLSAATCNCEGSDMIPTNPLPGSFEISAPFPKVQDMHRQLNSLLKPVQEHNEAAI